MERLQTKGVRIVVDATKDLLLNVLKYHPFLIKPNNHELGEMFGVTLKTDEEIITYAKKLQEKGAGNVLISMAGDGAILITEDGEIHKGLPPKGEVVNSVGAGDSMVAGFLTGYLNTGDYEKAFKLGIATGSATAFLAWLAEKDGVVTTKKETIEKMTLLMEKAGMSKTSKNTEPAYSQEKKKERPESGKESLFHMQRQMR